MERALKNDCLSYSFTHYSWNLNKKERIIEENNVLLHLWHQSQKGDNVAFRHLADRMYRSMFNYAFTFTTDREFVKDVIQDLLIGIWRKREKLQIDYVMIYFLRSLRNHLLQQFRRAQVVNTAFDTNYLIQFSDDTTVEETLIQQESEASDQERIQSAINKLPKRQREAVFLKFYEGLENDRIAELMQINRQSVANLLFKAVVSLKAQIA